MDRLSISKRYQDIIDEWRNSNVNFLDFSKIDNTGIFDLAFALGIDEPKPFSSSKYGFVRDEEKYIDYFQQALFASIILGKDQSNESIEECATLEPCFVHAEKCAERGFEILIDLYSNEKNKGPLARNVLRAGMMRLYKKYFPDQE